MANEEESYETALEALYSPLHQAATKEALAATAARRTLTVADMRTYLDRIQLSAAPFAVPKLVHVTGTKGKGSAACMCESVMRTVHKETTGLFTSPHLRDIRERIRINGRPVSRPVFGEAYWEIRRRLEKYRGSGGGDDGDTDDLPVLPGYFRMLTLMALFIFAHYEPAVTVMILEVGMGGRYDATNCLDMDWFQHTAVAGVTQLDYDHVRILGNTLEEIAWEKGGIFQVHKGTVASPHPKKGPQEGGQDSEVIRREVDGSKSRRFFALDTNTESSLEVLRQCARIEGEGGTLHLVGPSHQPVLPTDCKLGLPGSHQRVNAELAIALCEELEGEKRRDDVFAALANVTWPGRCQTVELPEGRTTLRLDGAHTVHSITAGLEWYQSVSQGGRRILFFNCSHERSPVELLELLMPARFECVYLCRADSERPSAVPKKSAKELLQDAGKSVEELQDTESSESPSTSWQKTLAVVWKQLEKEADHHSVEVASNLTAADALMRIKRSTNLATRNEVFVTGSLYLVGSMLTAIQWEELEAEGELRLRNR